MWNADHVDNSRNDHRIKSTLRHDHRGGCVFDRLGNRLESLVLAFSMPFDQLTLLDQALFVVASRGVVLTLCLTLSSHLHSL